jgi:hypothetical protein
MIRPSTALSYIQQTVMLMSQNLIASKNKNILVSINRKDLITRSWSVSWTPTGKWSQHRPLSSLYRVPSGSADQLCL